jgi:dolichyl-phosphooligosaccharide-protein glycotransferase
MVEDLDIKFDIKKVKAFWKKYYLTIVILLLIPIFLAGFFRAYTYDLPITDSWAEQTVTNNVQAQVQQNILQQYPDIDQQSLANLVTQQTNLYFSENSAEINAQINQFSKQIKAQYQDDSGQTYLLAIDPYHYYRQAQNIVDHGQVGDEIVNGKPFDNHMLAPNGRRTENALHPFIGATIYKIGSIFGDYSIMKAMFVIPMIFAMLAVIPIFFLTRRVAGNLGGFVAATLLAISPIFLGRTPAGFSDTDVYNIFFPLLIGWLFLESFVRRQKDRTRKIILGCLAGLTTGIFAFSWDAWWYIFDFIIAAIIFYIVYLVIKYKKKFYKNLKTKNALTTGLSYLVSTIVFVSISSGLNSFIGAIKGPLDFLFIKEAAKATLWPNVYTTVAELGDTSLTQVIQTLGGTLPFLMAVIGISLFFVKKNKKQYDIKYGIFLTIWFLGTLYSSVSGLRFSMFVVPVYAIALGVFAGKIYEFIKEKLPKSLQINKNFISIVFILLVIVLFITPIKTAHNTANGEVPSMNDAWHTALTKIKEETPEDAIITSWWDFGHWFKAIADRAVTFDGASQNRPQAHWVGKVLLTDNEKEAVAILRMLDCGGNNAYNLLLEETSNPVETKIIIDEALLMDKESARELISNYIENPDDIINNMFCNPPASYFITSEDMVSKAGVWAHFGSWNFERALAYNIVRSNAKEIAITLLQEELDYSQENAESTYRQLNGLTEREANAWIAPYPSYSNQGTCQTINETILCSNGAKIDLKENKAYINTNNGEIEIKEYRDDKQSYSSSEGSEEIAIAYFPDQSTTLLMHPELLNSMFTELFYYGGQNLENFELFDHQVGLNSFDIYTWQLKW